MSYGGSIDVQYTVICKGYCGEEHSEYIGSKAAFIREIKERGWALNENKDWICSDCVAGKKREAEPKACDCCGQELEDE